MVASDSLGTVLAQRPLHPFALHLQIHLLGSPWQAEAALESALLYPKAAPNAHHALHMPSHLHLRLGKWEEAVDWNQRAIAMSDLFLNSTGRQMERPDLFNSHSAEFLHYALLQQGRYKAAATHLARERSFAHSWRVAQMASIQLVETRNWTATLPPLVPTCETCADPRNLDGMFLLSLNSNSSLTYASGMAAAHTGDGATALAQASKLHAFADVAAPHMPMYARAIKAAAITVEAKAVELTHAEEALHLASKAFQESLAAGPSPNGWFIFTPAHETYASLLLLHGDASQALHVIQKAWDAGADRGRSRALLLHAQAVAAVGSQSAACQEFEFLASQLAHADSDCETASTVTQWLAQHTSTCNREHISQNNLVQDLLARLFIAIVILAMPSALIWWVCSRCVGRIKDEYPRGRVAVSAQRSKSGMKLPT